MDTINLEVLKQLQEYASVYFNAIVELNSTNGKCDLKPGKYSAKDMTDNSHKSVFGQYYLLPQNEEFDKKITVQSGTFRASFPYRQIFRILNEWENMCKAGKLKAVFEIGDIEIISAKVLTSEQTALGAYKTKTMKLQKVIGNWYRQVTKKKEDFRTRLYYKTDTLIFTTGEASSTLVDNPEQYKDRFSHVEKSLMAKIVEYAEEGNEYYKEVAKHLDLDKPTKDFTPLISSLSDLMEEIANTLELIAELTKELSAILINAFDELSGISTKLGCVLSMIGKAYEIELMAEMIAEPPTEEATTIIVEVKERATEPPQTQETPLPTETPPEQRNAEISVSVPPPDTIPPKQIIIVTPPPKYKPSNTLINYDWNNSLAPPHNLDYEPRNASNMACIADCRACYPLAYVALEYNQGNLCNAPPRKDCEETKSETARQMGRDRPPNRAGPSTPAERKGRATKTGANAL